MNFNDIPIKDIDHLLVTNNLPYNGNKYLTAWNYLLTHQGIRVPVSIANWINIYNLQNKFKDLPDEVVVEILKILDGKQLVSLCMLSKQFNFVCNNYLKVFLKEKLISNGYYVENIDDTNQLINILRMTELNKRSTTLIITNYIVDQHGHVKQVKIITEDSDSSDDEDEIDIVDLGQNNVVGLIDCHLSYYPIFLRNDGSICIYSGSNDFILINRYKNLIQCILCDDFIYFLESNGNVYRSEYENLVRGNLSSNLVVKNVSKMVNDNKILFFLTNNNEIINFNYGKIIHQGIKDINLYGERFFCIGVDNQLYIIVYDNYDLIKFVKIHHSDNVIKVFYRKESILMLKNDKSLYIYPVRDNNFTIERSPIKIKDNVSDISQSLQFLIKTNSNELYKLNLDQQSLFKNPKFRKYNIDGDIIFLENGYIFANNIIYKIDANDIYVILK